MIVTLVCNNIEAIHFVSMIDRVGTKWYQYMFGKGAETQICQWLWSQNWLQYLLLHFQGSFKMCQWLCTCSKFRLSRLITYCSEPYREANRDKMSYEPSAGPRHSHRHDGHHHRPRADLPAANLCDIQRRALCLKLGCLLNEVESNSSGRSELLDACRRAQGGWLRHVRRGWSSRGKDLASWEIWDLVQRWTCSRRLV